MQNPNLEQDPSRQLASGQYYFEEVETGHWYQTSSVILTDDRINRFADLTGDFFAIHMNDAAAQKLGFPRRVAHGLLVLALTDGLKNQAGATFHAVASLGWKWVFSTPVFSGDSISVFIRIDTKRETRNMERGILGLTLYVFNQHQTLVQSGYNELMVLRRTQASCG